MSERRLWRQILSGEEKPLEELVETYYGDIYAYCYRHVWNRQLALDLTQEVFLRFAGKLDTYEHKGKLKNYLYMIAGNLLKDQAKKKSTWKEAEVSVAVKISRDLRRGRKGSGSRNGWNCRHSCRRCPPGTGRSSFCAFIRS